MRRCSRRRDARAAGRRAPGCSQGAMRAGLRAIAARAGAAIRVAARVAAPRATAVAPALRWERASGEQGAKKERERGDPHVLEKSDRGGATARGQSTWTGPADGGSSL